MSKKDSFEPKKFPTSDRRSKINNNTNNQQNKISKRVLKNRNDHSIQKKSPIKIPESMVHKNELTFRDQIYQRFSQISSQRNFNCRDQKETITISKVSHESRKSNLGKKSSVISNWKGIVTVEEYQLIDHLWETTIKLGNHNNTILNRFIPQLQNVLRELIKSIAFSDFNQQIALASSQKIKLQNYVYSSYQEKEQGHKQYELSDLQSINPVQTNQYEDTNKNISHINTAADQDQTVPNSSLTIHREPQELELRKILYMIEGKDKGQKKIRDLSDLYAKDIPANIYYESMSSFNQNPSEDSGLILVEIENKQNIENSVRNYSDSENNFKIDLTDSVRNTQTSSSIKSRSEQSSNKHKVLQDIISMLNCRYNKNIKLQ